MDNVRQAAVANLFYPGQSAELNAMVDNFLSTVEASQLPPPKAIIAPHAGYIYSGPIAASAYAELYKTQHLIKRVVLLGPSHRVAFYGCAVSDADFFSTPLGNIPVDKEKIQWLLEQKLVTLLNEAHQLEHCLEVQLPFLQKIFKDIKIVPIVVGDATIKEVSFLIEKLWNGEDTIIVVSSDLSHYHSYDTAKQMDSKTSHAIEQLDFNAIDAQQACGYIPIRGLLHYAKSIGLTATTLDCRNSGDTAGPRDQVVGYGAYAFVQ